MIKDLLVNLSLNAKGDVASEFALSIGERFKAHVDALAFAYKMTYPGSVADGFAASLLTQRNEEFIQAANQAKSNFDAAANRLGVASSSYILAAEMADAGDQFGQSARCYDLAVVAQEEPDDTSALDLIIEGALFQSGRPTVVVPYINRAPLKLDRVAVCWDGGLNAARAVGNAMPFLKQAGKIEIVTVSAEQEKHKDTSPSRVAQHLSRHGLKPEIRALSSAGLSVVDAVLSYAADNSIDLIVMGAYGHSRLREFVLGGMTRDILRTMTVPVLMSH